MDGSWRIDYPETDRNFLYALEVGRMALSREEVEALRRYLEAVERMRQAGELSEDLERQGIDASRLMASVVQGLKEFEFTLRRELLVEEYYRALARDPDQPPPSEPPLP